MNKTQLLVAKHTTMSSSVIINEYLRCRNLIRYVKQVPARSPPGTSRVPAAHEIRKPINQQKLARHVIAVRQLASILPSHVTQPQILIAARARFRRWTQTPNGTGWDRTGRPGHRSLHINDNRTGTYAN